MLFRSLADTYEVFARLSPLGPPPPPATLIVAVVILLPDLDLETTCGDGIGLAVLWLLTDDDAQLSAGSSYV